MLRLTWVILDPSAVLRTGSVRNPKFVRDDSYGCFDTKKTFRKNSYHLPRWIAILPATTLTMPMTIFQLIGSTWRKKILASISDQTG